MIKAKLCAQLILHEGFKLVDYDDGLGNVTRGVGYNVTARGLDFWRHVTGGDAITAITTLQVLAADVDRVEAAVRASFPFYVQLDEVRQRVCCDLAFNVGYSALSFKNTIAAVEARDWSRATRELYKSKWAYQVDDGPGGRYGRADRLGHMLLTGEDYV